MPYTVLLVDDSETIRLAMIRAFQMARLPMDDVLQASDGEQALELLAQRWIDMVLTDLNMPGMGGEELIRRMRSDPELAQIPVAVISSERTIPRREILHGLGVRAVLHKPVRPEQFRDLLQTVLGAWK